MFKRLRNALAFFRRTAFTWRTAWCQAKPIGDWYSQADDEGNVHIVRGGR